MPEGMSFEALKARQSEAWGSAPWEPMAASIAAIHDHLVARLVPAVASAGSTSVRVLPVLPRQSGRLS